MDAAVLGCWLFGLLMAGSTGTLLVQVGRHPRPQPSRPGEVRDAANSRGGSEFGEPSAEVADATADTRLEIFERLKFRTGSPLVFVIGLGAGGLLVCIYWSLAAEAAKSNGPPTLTGALCPEAALPSPPCKPDARASEPVRIPAVVDTKVAEIRGSSPAPSSAIDVNVRIVAPFGKSILSDCKVKGAEVNASPSDRIEIEVEGAHNAIPPQPVKDCKAHFHNLELPADAELTFRLRGGDQRDGKPRCALQVKSFPGKQIASGKELELRLADKWECKGYGTRTQPDCSESCAL